MQPPPNAPPPGGYGLPPPPGGFGAGAHGGGGHGFGPSPVGPMAGMPAYGVDPLSGLPLSDKSKIVAGVLSIFLGSFGVGRFYLGHVGVGIGQLAITVLTCGILGWIWPVIDAIFIFTGKVTDAQGRPLRE